MYQWKSFLYLSLQSQYQPAVPNYSMKIGPKSKHQNISKLVFKPPKEILTSKQKENGHHKQSIDYTN